MIPPTERQVPYARLPLALAAKGDTGLSETIGVAHTGNDTTVHTTASAVVLTPAQTRELAAELLARDPDSAERMAAAMYACDHPVYPDAWHEVLEPIRDNYRELAQAALAALRTS